MPENGHLVV